MMYLKLLLLIVGNRFAFLNLHLFQIARLMIMHTFKNEVLTLLDLDTRFISYGRFDCKEGVEEEKLFVSINCAHEMPVLYSLQKVCWVDKGEISQVLKAMSASFMANANELAVAINFTYCFIENLSSLSVLVFCINGLIERNNIEYITALESYRWREAGHGSSCEILG